MDTPLTGQAPTSQAQAAIPPTTEDTDGQAPQGTPDIEELLKEVRALRKEAGSYRTKLRAAEEAEEQRKRSEMTELEKLKADLDAERQARTAAEQQRQQQLLRSQVISAAAKAGFNDPQDAVNLLNPENLVISDDGQIGGLEQELKALLTAKPYLAKQSGTISPTNPAGGAAGQSDAERLKRIYGLTGKSNIFGGPGGGVVWNSKE